MYPTNGYCWRIMVKSSLSLYGVIAGHIVESRVGVGSVFTVTLPRAPVDEPAAVGAPLPSLSGS